MSYPGNPNLADDVQRRVLSTFESMLREVVQGNHQEALLGCSLIERMDPRFKPMTELKARLERGDERVEVHDLATMLDIELPADGREEATPSVGAAPAPPTTPGETPAAPETPGDESATGELSDDRSMQEPHVVESEHIETVETEPFEESDEHIEVMSDDEMREFMAQTSPPAAETEASETGESGSEGSKVEAVGAPAEAAEETPDEVADEEPEADAGDRSADGPAAQEDDRVSALLQEGQAAFDAGEYQTAIDSWSRIFLIDLDHADASDKVEEAKRLLAEREREAEELFHTAIEKLEAGDTAGARESLEATLERRPGHVGAREHLDRLKAGTAEPGEASEPETPAPRPSDLSAEPQVPTPPPDSVPVESIPQSGGATSAADVDLEGPATVAGEAGKERSGLSPRFLGIAAVGLLVVLVAAWFLFSRRDSVFPNTTAQVESGSIHAVDRAQRQRSRGQTEAALDTLAAVPATDPRYSEAQTLLERWQQEADATFDEAQQDAAEADAERAAHRAALIAEARRALDSGLPHRAVEPLAEAEGIAALNEQEAALREAARDRLKAYGEAWLPFRDGDYRTAMRPLWERVRENPDDAIARDMLVTTQFNLARSSLVSGNPSDAAALLSEAAKLAPRDHQIQQALRFAEHYVGLPRDLRYRIFIKHLPIR